MTAEHIKLLIVLTVVFGAAITIPVSMFWFDYRTKTKALDLLRTYAERGEEPPASVVQAVTGASGWVRPPQPGAPTRRTRGNWLAHAAANTVFTVGLTTLAWWRFSTVGEFSGWVIAFTLAALFFAAALAAQLVGAYYAPPQ
jgi:hypothetical protein